MIYTLGVLFVSLDHVIYLSSKGWIAIFSDFVVIIPFVLQLIIKAMLPKPITVHMILRLQKITLRSVLYLGVILRSNKNITPTMTIMTLVSVAVTVSIIIPPKIWL